MMLNGQGGPVDLIRGIELLEQQCDTNNDPWACGSLGHQYSIGRGLPKDPCRARELHERSCAVNHNHIGCSNLGDSLVHGDCGTKDIARARALLETTCTEFGSGCATLGQLYEKGNGAGSRAWHARSPYGPLWLRYIVHEADRSRSVLRSERGWNHQPGV
ncbi:MAG: sel1 repeat family protein [Bradymonadaceae bacterium]|nr:sel1 repeat family protein [Lujinxingiaceae bacterium]